MTSGGRERLPLCREYSYISIHVVFDRGTQPGDARGLFTRGFQNELVEAVAIPSGPGPQGCRLLAAYTWGAGWGAGESNRGLLQVCAWPLYTLAGRCSWVGLGGLALGRGLRHRRNWPRVTHTIHTTTHSDPLPDAITSLNGMTL